MAGGIIGFAVWAVFGAAFIVLGIYVSLSKKERAFGFWANAKAVPITDVTGYNRALGRLWRVFGAVFILLGLPLLTGSQNSPFIMISILGAMFASIAAMVIYELGILRKYRA